MKFLIAALVLAATPALAQEVAAKGVTVKIVKSMIGDVTSATAKPAND